jgi:eukaryotic-like serine/threonine-protein kinase
MAPVLAVGQVIGTYAIVRRVGAGGMGEIYEVSHSRLAGRYAMKVLRPEVAATPEALARFQREAKVTSALQHPNIVHVIDFSTIEDGSPYLVMEFLDGPELLQVMKRSGPLRIPQVVSYVKQIASGLTAAHEHGVVHRDLKPQNIFVLKVKGNDQELIKIVDFGISKINAMTATITSASTVIGTAQYMSPEQARGLIDEIDAKSDQFSLALIVYEMLTGQTAFQGDNVSSVVYQIVHEEPRGLGDPDGPIPPLVAAVLKRALAKDKERRFPTVKAFADALEGAATAPSDASATTMASERSLLDAGVREEPSPPRRIRLGVGLAALAIAGVTAVGLLRHERPKANDLSASSAIPGPPPKARPPASAPASAPTVPRKPPEPEPAATATVPERSKRDAPKTNHRPKLAITAKPAIASKPALPAPQRTNCDPNYYVDAQGFKHFKPECFLEKAGP